MIRRIGVGCLAIIVLLIVVAVISAALTGHKASSNPKSASMSGRSGSTIHVPDNLDVTLTGYTVSQGNAVEVPKPGDEFVITHWKFHNFRSSNTDVADTGFKAQSRGVIRDAVFASSLTKNELGSAGTSLAPGATTTGDIVFEIAKGDHHAMVIYQPDAFDSSKKATWTL